MNSPQQQTVISDEYAEEFNKTHKLCECGKVVSNIGWNIGDALRNYCEECYIADQDEEKEEMKCVCGCCGWKVDSTNPPGCLKEESDWEGGIIPDCDSCKKTFAEDGSNYNEKDGDLICDDCEEKYECFCQRCGEKIPLGMDETPEEQKEWFNKDDELKFCDDCEDPNCLFCDNCDKHFMRDGEEHDLVHMNEDGDIFCQDCLEYCDCENCNEKKEEEVEECDKCGFPDVSYCMSNGCEDVEEEEDIREKISNWLYDKTNDDNDLIDFLINECGVVIKPWKEEEEDNHDLMDFLIEKMVTKPWKEEEE